MEPKLTIKSRKTGLLIIEVLNSTQHLVVDLELLALVARLRLRLRRERGGSAAAALQVLVDRHFGASKK